MSNAIKVCLIRRAADLHNHTAYEAFIRRLVINAATGGSHRVPCKCKSKRSCLDLTKEDAENLYEKIKQEDPLIIGEFVRLFRIPTSDDLAIEIGLNRIRMADFLKEDPWLEASAHTIIHHFNKWKETLNDERPT